MAMVEDNRTKSDFEKNKDGRTILGTAKDIAKWIELGFEEQEKEKFMLDIIQESYIDLRNCDLFISYPIGSKDVKSTIFNFCDIAGIIPYTRKDESPNNEYFYIVDKDIYFDNSILRGGFFHYVWFKGDIRLNKTEISTCSFFKCKIDGNVWIMASVFDDFTVTNSYFSKIFYISRSTVNSLNFSFDNCEFGQYVKIYDSKITISGKEEHGRRLAFYHCKFHDKVQFSELTLNGNPLIFEDCALNGFSAEKVNWEDSLIYINKSSINGISLFSVSEKNKSIISELYIWSSTIKGQLYIENYKIHKITINFSEFESSSRMRLYLNNISTLRIRENTIHGRFDVEHCNILEIDCGGSICTGTMNFDQSQYKTLANLATIRLLKEQARKSNDTIAYLKLYSIEVDAYEKGLPWKNPDKAMLRLNKMSNNYGQSWVRGIIFILLIVIIGLTLINIFGRSFGIPSIDLSNKGLQNFISDCISILNVFNIMKFGQESLNLNGYGLLVCFLVRIFILYGGYQTIVAFRRLNQNK